MSPKYGQYSFLTISIGSFSRYVIHFMRVKVGIRMKYGQKDKGSLFLAVDLKQKYSNVIKLIVSYQTLRYIKFHQLTEAAVS